MTQTYNYMAAILVVFFGLWLFSGNNRHYPATVTSNVVADAAQENHAVVITHYRQSSEMLMDGSGDRDVASNHSQPATGFVQPVSDSGNTRMAAAAVSRVAYNAQSASGVEAGATENSADASTSDGDWFAAVMNKARTLSDRIINIDISGSTAQTVVNNENTGDVLADENSLLPQPTESEALADNKPDCPSMMYMGGNAYGRNMLIRMGCPVP